MSRTALVSSSALSVERQEVLPAAPKTIADPPPAQRIRFARAQTSTDAEADAPFLRELTVDSRKRRIRQRSVRHASRVPGTNRRSKPNGEKVSAVDRRRVSFDLDSGAKSPVEQEVLPAAEKPLTDASRFSRPCCFPTQCLQEGSAPKRALRKPLVAVKLSVVNKLADMVPMDEFLQMESTLKAAENEEANDKRVLNFHKMLKIVKESVQEPSEHREVVKEMTKHRFEHFVLLVQRPHLQLLGIYLLKADLAKIEKLWGSGPRFVKPADVHTCWYYNVMTNEFNASQRQVFQSNLDAVST
jgi:hypothetical protein